MPVLTDFQTAYVALWAMLSSVAFVSECRRHKSSPLFRSEYYRHLFLPWKLATFALATGSLCCLSTLGYDPTWDVPETLLMSAMTFLFAPYSVGVVYRYAKGFRRVPAEAFSAAVLTFFVSAWFYDAYAAVFLLGEYPKTAFSNLGLSPYFYVLAGIFWSLECDGRRVGVSFARREWFEVRPVGKCWASVLLVAVPIVAFMVAIF